ncbi:MAG: hypothetical protein II823_06405, partial [Kiritimatiellae bacterium]|nr:hypothetical protein [Kiritimatiellia bacterium]
MLIQFAAYFNRWSVMVAVKTAGRCASSGCQVKAVMPRHLTAVGALRAPERLHLGERALNRQHPDFHFPRSSIMVSISSALIPTIAGPR